MASTLRQRAAANERRQALENQFDPEVITQMRAEFKAADTDGSGEVLLIYTAMFLFCGRYLG